MLWGCQPGEYIQGEDRHKYVIPYLTSSFSTPFSSPCTAANHDDPQSSQNQSSQEQPNFSDASGPLFNMYLKMAEDKDSKMTDHWQKDADRILIFVGPHINLQVHPLSIVNNVNIVDWYILCHCHSIGCSLYPGP
jgi:hypothetical protein